MKILVLRVYLIKFKKILRKTILLSLRRIGRKGQRTLKVLVFKGLIY